MPASNLNEHMRPRNQWDQAEKAKRQMIKMIKIIGLSPSVSTSSLERLSIFQVSENEDQDAMNVDSEAKRNEDDLSQYNLDDYDNDAKVTG